MDTLEDLTVYDLVRYINDSGLGFIEFGAVRDRVKQWHNDEHFGKVKAVEKQLLVDGVPTMVVDYLISSRQCIFIASMVNMHTLAYVVARVMFLEVRYKQRTTALISAYNVVDLCSLLKERFKVEVDIDEVELAVLNYFIVPGFGNGQGFVTVKNSEGRELLSSKINGLQSMMIAGLYSCEAMMWLIDKLDLLEKEFEPDNVLQQLLPEALQKLRLYVEEGIAPFENSKTIESLDATGMKFYFRPGFYINTIIPGGDTNVVLVFQDPNEDTEGVN